MKIVVIGGHLTPAMAVIDELKDHQILYIGRKNALEGDKALSFEYQEIQKLGIKFKSLIAGRLQRKFTIHTIPSLLKFPIGFFQSFFILRSFKPNVVLGFGGYVQLPVILSSVILRIPVVIHEQALSAGLVNRMVSIFVKKICISWDSSRVFFPKSKTVLTGNPIRSEIYQSEKSEESKSEAQIKTIYVTGGSLGSHAINLLIEKSCSSILRNLRIIHQTGDAKKYGDFERLEEQRNKLPENLRKRYFLKKFLNSLEVSQVLRSSDIVVSRSGINTICELMYLKKPSLLIPLPFGREQRENAVFLKNLGLAEFLDQETLTTFQFQNAIEAMIKNLDSYKKNGEAAKSLIKEDAAKKIAEEVLNVV